MSKWADNLISHVRHDEQNRITNVILHVDQGETVSIGVSKTKDEVITLLKKGYEIETTTWNYPRWFRGAKVDYVRESNGIEYLRTLRNKTERDNLDNLIPF